MSNSLITIGNVRGFIDINKIAQLNLEDVARGLGFTEVAKSGNECVRWRTVKGYLVELGVIAGSCDVFPEFIPENIFYRLAFKAKNKAAEDFQSLVCDEILPTIRRTGHYETPEYKLLLAMNDRILSLESKIDKRYKPQVNPGYIYKCAWNDYQRITGDESKRGMNGALNDYIGGVPYANQIRPVSVTDWVCKNIGTEVLEQFIADIDDGLIVKSKAGHWVNLGGYACNDVEWAKVLNEFDHKCAYCNASEDDVPLIPEHIIAQSVLSAVHPEKVDLIGNIVPACGKCNESKGTQDMVMWYRKHPEFSEYNLQKIQRYQYKYEV